MLLVTVTSTAGATEAPAEAARPAAAAMWRKSLVATTVTCWPALGESAKAEDSLTRALLPMVASVVELMTLTAAASTMAAPLEAARPME
jgi:hypothetical protein